MRNLMSPVESPFSVQGATTTVPVAPTPFAVVPSPPPVLTEGNAGGGRRYGLSEAAHDGEPRRARAALHEVDQVLASGRFRALLLDANRSDLLVHVDDVDRCVEGLFARGFDIDRAQRCGRCTTGYRERRYDLAVRSTGGVRLDDQMLARGRTHPERAVGTRVMSSEDLIVTDALENSADCPHHWHDALERIARCDLDWDYLGARARRCGPRRVLSLLLYAESADLAVPADVVERLFDAVHLDATRTR